MTSIWQCIRIQHWTYLFYLSVYFLYTLKQKLVLFYSVFLSKIRSVIRVRRRCRIKYNLRSKFLTHTPATEKIDRMGHLACDSIISARTNEIPVHATWCWPLIAYFATFPHFLHVFVFTMYMYIYLAIPRTQIWLSTCVTIANNAANTDNIHSNVGLWISS